MKLLIEDDQGNRSVVPVIRDEITIGRKEGNTIRLTERNVSRRHARLVQSDGKIFVEEVAARYGLKKNGKKVDRSEFNEGDVISIGDYRLTLRPEKSSKKTPDTNQANAEISPDLTEERSAAGDESGPVAKDGASAKSKPSKPSKPKPSKPSSSPSADSGGNTEIIQTDPAKIVVISSNFAGQEFPLDNQEMVIGRGEDCDIIVDHRSVSSKHAKIVREGTDEYKIVDLNSSNGVKVSGEEYKSVHLERGDVVELGHVKFRFVEPGENYVFTPQSSSDEIPTGSIDDSSMNPVPIAIAAVAILLVAGGVLVAMSGGGGDGETDGTTGGAQAGAAAGAGGDDEESAADKEQEESNRKVSKLLDKAEKDIESGKLEKAIGSLESTRELREPTPEQGRRIDDLLSKARNEKPFRRSFESARQAVENESYEAALDKLSKIPDHSVFKALADKEGLQKEALDAILKQAVARLDDKKYDEARSRAEMALRYDSHKGDAQKVLDKIDEMKKKAEEAARKAEAVAERGGSGGGGRPTATGSSGGGGSTGGAAPSEPSVSAAEAKELYRGATKKWIRGDHAGAISQCRKALQGGHTACYRVMGMANKQMGNKSAACSNFKKYLGTSPSDASKIRNQMDKLGCP